jgi:hypothetical protein
VRLKVTPGFIHRQCGGPEAPYRRCDRRGGERTKAAAGDENAVDATTLNIAAHRLEGLIHDRRDMLAKKPVVASAAQAKAGGLPRQVVQSRSIKAFANKRRDSDWEEVKQRTGCNGRGRG